MNGRTIRRRIIDQTDPWEIAQQLCDTANVLRIAMSKHNTVQRLTPAQCKYSRTVRS
jgi:hypothetical protein